MIIQGLDDGEFKKCFQLSKPIGSSHSAVLCVLLYY